MKQLVKEFVREMVKGAAEHGWARLFRSEGGKECTALYIPFLAPIKNKWCTLPETNSSHLKMDGWNTIVSFWDGLSLFSGAFAVSFREGTILDVSNLLTKPHGNFWEKTWSLEARSATFVSSWYAWPSQYDPKMCINLRSDINISQKSQKESSGWVFHQSLEASRYVLFFGWECICLVSESRRFLDCLGREGDECLASGWQFDVCEMWFDKAETWKGKHRGEFRVVRLKTRGLLHDQ